MKFYPKNQKISFSTVVIILLSLMIFHPDNMLKASEDFRVNGHPLLTVKETPDTKPNEYFRLVEARIIEAQHLDDQMLEKFSPALVAPRTVKIPALSYRQKSFQEFHHSVCFKRCHSQNDFSVSDYTSQQWSRLIEQDGHSIFSEIPWEKAEAKEKIFRFLTNNAKNATPAPEGIGAWN